MTAIDRTDLARQGRSAEAVVAYRAAAGVGLRQAMAGVDE